MGGLKRPFRAEADDDRRAARVQAEVAAARGGARPGERRPQPGEPGRAVYEESVADPLITDLAS